MKQHDRSFIVIVQVVGVAAKSDKAKAESLAKKYGIPAAYGTYEELAKDPNVGKFSLFSLPI